MNALRSALLVSLGFLCCAFATPQSARQDVRFAAFDVLIDAGATPLAAWQVELTDPSDRATIVGVEGGDPTAARAYAEPPYYDPRALSQGRIVLGAFSTGDTLPTGRVRVARVHVRVLGPEPLDWDARLVVAGAPDGRSLAAVLELVPSR